MKEVKFFEIRDRATFIPAMAVKIQQSNDNNNSENWLLFRSGCSTGTSKVFLTHLVESKTAPDPYSWHHGTRTMREAHKYIVEHWDELESGAIVDVEYILGESEEPKQTERMM